MGGKKKIVNGNEVSAKTENKFKAKVVDDKTFGLKNKNKSAKVQNYVKSVQQQVMNGNAKGGIRGAEEAKHAGAKEKKKKEAELALLASLYKNAQNLSAKNANDADLALTQQINLYRDPRAGTENMPEDTIITCKFFLDAVEDDLYGWRWECANGSKCVYRHQLPEGYVVVSKKEREKMRREQEELDKLKKATLEEDIEADRAALPSEGLTPVTKETFAAWKQRRKDRRQKELEDKLKEQEEQKAQGKKVKVSGGKVSVMNGRALFQYNPDLFEETEEEVKKAEEGQIDSTTKVDENLFAGGEVNDDEEEVDFD